MATAGSKVNAVPEPWAEVVLKKAEAPSEAITKVVLESLAEVPEATVEAAAVEAARPKQCPWNWKLFLRFVDPILVRSLTHSVHSTRLLPPWKMDYLFRTSGAVP